MATEQADGSNYRDDSTTLDEDSDGSNYRDDSETIDEDSDGAHYRDDNKGISEVADGSNYREPTTSSARAPQLRSSIRIARVDRRPEWPLDEM